MMRSRQFVLVLAGLLIGAALSALAVLWHGDYRAYAVRTGSMTPTYPPGDLVLVAPAARYAVGDVITFRSSGPNPVTTHRVNALVPDGYETKGDANETADAGTVRPTSIVGRVIAGVPRGGYALVYLQQPAGIASVVTVLLALSFSWSLFFPAEPAESEPRPKPKPARGRHVRTSPRRT